MASTRGKKLGAAQNELLSSAELLQLEVRSSLEATWITNVRIVQSQHGTLCALFNIRPGLDVQWRRLMREIVPALEQLPFDVWIGQRFMLDGGRMVAPWFLQIEIEPLASLKRAVQEVRKVLMRVISGGVPEPRTMKYEWFTAQLARRGDGLIENMTLHPRLPVKAEK